MLYQIGRMLFGLGGESINIAQTTLIATWFRKRELGTFGCAEYPLE